MHLPALRFGKRYESLDRATLVHFLSGETVAEVSQVGGAMLSRDLQKFSRAARHAGSRQALCLRHAF